MFIQLRPTQKCHKEIAEKQLKVFLFFHRNPTPSSAIGGIEQTGRIRKGQRECCSQKLVYSSQNILNSKNRFSAVQTEEAWMGRLRGKRSEGGVSKLFAFSSLKAGSRQSHLLGNPMPEAV